MKRSFLFKSILILCIFAFPSCKYYTYGLEEFLYRSGTVEKRTESVLELTDHDVPVVPNEGNYNFLIVADIHFGHQVYKNDVDLLITSVTDYLNTIPEDEKPLFCICLGDIAEHGLKSEFDDFSKFANKLLSFPLEKLESLMKQLNYYFLSKEQNHQLRKSLCIFQNRNNSVKLQTNLNLNI